MLIWTISRDSSGTNSRSFLQQQLLVSPPRPLLGEDQSDQLEHHLDSEGVVGLKGEFLKYQDGKEPWGCKATEGEVPDGISVSL